MIDEPDGKLAQDDDPSQDYSETSGTRVSDGNITWLMVRVTTDKVHVTKPGFYISRYALQWVTIVSLQWSDTN